MDFSFSSISLSFQSKVTVFADFQNDECCPTTLVIGPALFGVGWSISIRELISASTNLCLMPWTESQRERRVCFSLFGLREVTSTAESLSRSDSRLCGLPSVSTSPTFTASDLVVPFQPRWSAPPPVYTGIFSLVEGVEYVLFLRLLDEPRRSAAFFFERWKLRSRLKIMPTRSDCAMPLYVG